MIQFPEQDHVATAIAGVQRAYCEPCECPEDHHDDDGCSAVVDVRLQVWPDGQWIIRWGLSDYDPDHRGFWGASSVDLDDDDEVLQETARDLIEQAKDDAAQCGEDIDD